MQLIHAIVALVAASQATAIASNPNLMARSGIAEAANMKYTRDVDECKAACDTSFARRADVDNAKSDCLEKCASDNQGEDGKAKRGNNENDDDKKDKKEEKDKKKEKEEEKEGEKKEKEKEEVECFAQCSPHPGQNLCHESAPCTYIAGRNKYYCGCPTGLKPDDISPENAFRLPWVGQEARILVKPGATCYNRCENILACTEVAVQPQCF